MVDHVVRLELAHRPGQHVGKDQPALGIGVDDLDRLAFQGLVHIAGSICLCTGHVLGRTHDGMNLDGKLEPRGSEHDAEGRGGPGHVALHVHHRARGLDAQAACVEGQALPDENDLLLWARRFVDHVNDARLDRAAFVHREQQVHAFFFDASLVPHAAGQPELLGLARGGAGQGHGGQVIGWAVHEITGEIGAFCDRFARPDRSGEAALAFRGAENDGGCERRARLLVALVLGVAVGPADEPLGHGADRFRSDCGELDRRALLRACNGCERMPHLPSDLLNVFDLADPHEQQPTGLRLAACGDFQCLRRLAFEAFVGSEWLDAALPRDGLDPAQRSIELRLPRWNGDRDDVRGRLVPSALRK